MSNAIDLGPRPDPHLISFAPECFAPGPIVETFHVPAYRKPHGLFGGGRTFGTREAAEAFLAERIAAGAPTFGVIVNRDHTTRRVRWF